MDKIKLVVVDENILGYVRPCQDENSWSYYAGILHASILRGACRHDGTTVLLKGREVRLATAQDFDNFRVSFIGFNNPNLYEYDNKFQI